MDKLNNSLVSYVHYSFDDKKEPFKLLHYGELEPHNFKQMCHEDGFTLKSDGITDLYYKYYNGNTEIIVNSAFSETFPEPGFFDYVFHVIELSKNMNSRLLGKYIYSINDPIIFFEKRLKYLISQMLELNLLSSDFNKHFEIGQFERDDYSLFIFQHKNDGTDYICFGNKGKK